MKARTDLQLVPGHAGELLKWVVPSGPTWFIMGWSFSGL